VAGLRRSDARAAVDAYSARQRRFGARAPGEPVLSRIVVAAVLLPVVLGIVWLGGWWLFGLAAVGGLLALHELYAMARALRPIVLGGYVGLVLDAPRGSARRHDVAAGGDPLDATRCAARLLRLERPPARGGRVRRDASRRGVGGGGRRARAAPRDIPSDGRLLIFTTLLAVFADDTRGVLRRAGDRSAPHRARDLAREVVGGFVGGTVAAVRVTFFALYEQDVVTTGSRSSSASRSRWPPRSATCSSRR
jgi:hypothetical protein